MAKITGLGGVFFKTDRKATAKWLTEKLDLPTEEWGRMFPWRDDANPDAKGFTVLGLHAKESDYFGPSTQPFMLNFSVDDLEGMLGTLRSRGVEIIKEFPADENGRFAHVVGPDGITIELWQPAS
jgi:predicted enzyme related to lactoylglutathione lyase